MLEISNTQSVVINYNISIYESWSIEQDQMIVELNGKKYFCMSVHLQKDWSSDTADWKLEGLQYPDAEARLVSVLKNGKPGNDFRDQMIYEGTFNGVFQYMFDAYKQELAKTPAGQLAEVN